MGFRNVVTDGTSNAPRLRMQYNMWALTKLPRDAAEWTTPERLDKLSAAGFTGFEAFAKTPEEADELGKMLRDRGMGIGFGAIQLTRTICCHRLSLPIALGPDYITAQVFGSLRSAPEIAELLQEMFELVNDAGLPLFIETHRGRVTQDLRRTNKVIKKFGKVRFTGDFSHYIVAGELGGVWPEEVWQHFIPIAQRCGNWHGRIGFGEQVQNDIGDGSGEMPQQFKKLWEAGMSAWLKKARPGDVLPFCCELGPPLYSITDLSGREISDRWQQSLVIKRLAEEAWAEALANLTPVEAEPATV